MTTIIRVGQDRILSKIAIPKSLVATFGNLDGLHIGHAELLKRVKTEAKSLPTALITLYPHPSEVFGHVKKLERILSVRELVSVISSFGIDYLIYLHFNRSLASLDYKSFIEKYFISILNIKRLVVGEDARVGREALGTADKIKDIMEEDGRVVDIISFVKDTETGDKISSRKIREMIKDGDFEGAKRVLGRRFFIQGKVVRGAGRGKPLGFPTLNIYFAPNHILPANGVYIVLTEIDGIAYKSVSNIGVRPTFSGKNVKLEVHVPDHTLPDLYGKNLSIHFCDRIREEKKFNSTDELSEQISQDIQAMKIYFNKVTV